MKEVNGEWSVVNEEKNFFEPNRRVRRNRR